MRAVHISNAPSLAAASSLALAQQIADAAEHHLSLARPALQVIPNRPPGDDLGGVCPDRLSRAGQAP